MTHVAVRCTGLSKRFGRVPAVQGINLELPKGGFLALLGPSGCGKTSLLRLIAGFEAPDAGTIDIGERRVAGPADFVPPEKRRVGLVFQDYALFPHLSVAANIAYGLPRGDGRRARVAEMLSLVNLKGYESRMPHELSGGEQQRVALARALAPAPEVLLLDEPFSNLDADLRTRMRGEVKGILASAGASVIFVTHDQEEAMFMGDKVGVMNAGRLEQVDAPEVIFHWPATPFVAQFLGIADFLSGIVQGETVTTEMGNLPLAQKLPKGGRVQVMVRPDLIGIQPSPQGKGVIEDRTFLGLHFLYRVRLPSGASVRSLQRHSQSYQVGTHVELKLTRDHGGVVCFAASDVSEEDAAHPSTASGRAEILTARGEALEP